MMVKNNRENLFISVIMFCQSTLKVYKKMKYGSLLQICDKLYIVQCWSTWGLKVLEVHYNICIVYTVKFCCQANTSM